jgi:hypothetical protein
MKFFPKILKLTLLGWTAAFAISAWPKPSAKSNAEIATLEKKEFDESANLEIKEKLAKAYWCAGFRGLAVEKWLWLHQFFQTHDRRPQWESLIRTAGKKPDELSQILSCPK